MTNPAIDILTEIKKLRDDLYDSLPSGEMKVWDLLLCLESEGGGDIRNIGQGESESYPDTTRTSKA